MSTKKFTRVQLLSLTDGRLSTEMKDVYNMLNHIFNENFQTFELGGALTRLKEIAPDWYVSELKYLEKIPKDIKENFDDFIRYVEKDNIEVEVPQIN